MKTLFFLAAIHILCAGNKPISKDYYRGTVDNPLKKSWADTAGLSGQWYLVPVLASDTAAGKIPFLQINTGPGTFTGNTGCNNMRGSFQQTDTSFVFNKNIITTKMMCAGYNEAAFLQSLLRTNKYKIVNGELILLFDATELSRWSRKKAAKKVLST